ncbi:hypothetical protein FPV67DRAFT_1778707 [Lyophyllum atratum]|nr:hypothetical protein FPV67DRAFT_1778707 [Lyophyllum atratum]
MNARRDDDDWAQQQHVDQYDVDKDEAKRASHENIMEEAERRRLLEEDIWTAEVQPKQRTRERRERRTEGDTAKKAKELIPTHSPAKTSRNLKVGDAPSVTAEPTPRPKALAERALPHTQATLLHHKMQAHPATTPDFPWATVRSGISYTWTHVGEASLPANTAPCSSWDKIPRSSSTRNLATSTGDKGKYDSNADVSVLVAPTMQARYNDHGTKLSSSQSIHRMDIENHPVMGRRIVPSSERRARNPQHAQQNQEPDRIVNHTQPAPAARRMLATDPRIFDPPSTIQVNVEEAWREGGATDRRRKQEDRTRTSPDPKPTRTQGPPIVPEDLGFPSQRYGQSSRIEEDSPHISAKLKLRGLQRWESENESTLEQDAFRNRVEDVMCRPKVGCEPTERNNTSVLDEDRTRVAGAPSDQNVQIGPAGPVSVAQRHADPVGASNYRPVASMTPEMRATEPSALMSPSLGGHVFTGNRSATRDEQESFPVPPSPPWAKSVKVDLVDPRLSAQRYDDVARSHGQRPGNAGECGGSYTYDGAAGNGEAAKSAEDGVFAPEVPGCRTATCRHRFRFSTREELETYFGGATLKSMAKTLRPIDPDVLGGTRCLASLSMNMQRRR